MFGRMLTIAFALAIVVCVCMSAGTVEAQHVENGLVGYWTFNAADISGKTVKDVAGNYDGTMKGNPRVVAGKVGEALQFDQKSLDDGGDYVDLGTDINKEMTGPFTVEGWFRMSFGVKDVKNAVHVLVASRKGAWGDGEGTLLQYNNNRLKPNGEFEGHIMSFSIHYKGTCWLSAGGVDKPVKLEKDKWYHVAATFDGSKSRIYSNGQVIGELACAKPAVQAKTSLLIAHSVQMSTGWNLMGAADEVRIYDRALDEGEINQNLQAVSAVNSGDKLASSWGAMKTAY